MLARGHWRLGGQPNASLRVAFGTRALLGQLGDGAKPMSSGRFDLPPLRREVIFLAALSAESFPQVPVANETETATAEITPLHDTLQARWSSRRSQLFKLRALAQPNWLGFPGRFFEHSIPRRHDCHKQG
jgi:hypothetical protein